MNPPPFKGAYSARLAEVTPTEETTPAPQSSPPVQPASEHPNCHGLGVWRAWLDEAGDESHVVLIVREYIASWGPEQLARLSPPRRIADRDDINELALELTRARCRLDGAAGDELTLVEMVAVAMHAVARLAEIAARRKR